MGHKKLIKLSVTLNLVPHVLSKFKNSNFQKFNVPLFQEFQREGALVQNIPPIWSKLRGTPMSFKDALGVC